MNDKTPHEQRVGELPNAAGEVTPKQNAGARLNDLNDQVHGERRMEARQMAGAVESQTQVHRPSASDPGGGFPPAVDGKTSEPLEEAEE